MGQETHLKEKASYSSKRMTFGGSLTVTPQQIRFEPNPLERRFGAKDLLLSTEEVISVDEAARTFNPLNGGLRKRLAIHTARGDHLFVVNRLKEVRSKVRSLLALSE